MANKPDHILWVYGGTLITNFNVAFREAMERAIERTPMPGAVVTREAYDGLGQLLPNKCALHMVDKRWTDLTLLWKLLKDESDKRGLDFTQLCNNGALLGNNPMEADNGE